eukprot:scaffold238016_cov18-Tisochrysis_lutea.AAC.2
MVGMKFIALELRWLCSDELCTQHCKGVTRVKRGWPSWYDHTMQNVSLLISTAKQRRWQTHPSTFVTAGCWV